MVAAPVRPAHQGDRLPGVPARAARRSEWVRRQPPEGSPSCPALPARRRARLGATPRSAALGTDTSRSPRTRCVSSVLALRAEALRARASSSTSLPWPRRPRAAGSTRPSLLGRLVEDQRHRARRRAPVAGPRSSQDRRSRARTRSRTPWRERRGPDELADHPSYRPPPAIDAAKLAELDLEDRPRVVAHAAHERRIEVDAEPAAGRLRPRPRGCAQAARRRRRRSGPQLSACPPGCAERGGRRTELQHPRDRGGRVARPARSSWPRSRSPADLVPACRG